jgi:outer membrane protein OmpA-like peptidoglycan-associated protein
MKARNFSLLAAATFLVAAGAAHAQTTTPAPTPAPAPATAAPQVPPSTTAAAKPAPATASAASASQAPTSLSIYFASGSYTIAPKETATLDEASRIFNDGKPIVMIITGMADATGAPAPNLLLSQKRADVVFAGLVARGLPPNHFQILAKGATDALTASEPSGVPDPHFRKVEITWR